MTPNGNLIDSVDVSYSSNDLNGEIRYWGGFKIEPEWTSLTFHVYKTGAKGSKIELFWGGFEKIIET